MREDAKRTSRGINIYLLDRDIVVKCLEQGRRAGQRKSGREGRGEIVTRKII